MVYVTCLAFDLDILLLEYDTLDYYPWIIVRPPRRGEFTRVSGRGLGKRRKIGGVWSREEPNSLSHSKIEAGSVKMATKIDE